MKHKKLKDLIALSCNIKVYIPSTMEVSRDINEKEHEKIVNDTLQLLGNIFGGATSFKALGSWLSQESGLVKEKVTICEIFCDSDTLENNIEKVIIFCEKLKNDLKQEAIALEVNNILHFV